MKRLYERQHPKQLPRKKGSCVSMRHIVSAFPCSSVAIATIEEAIHLRLPRQSHLRVGDPLTALPSTNIAALLIRRKHVFPRPDMFPGVRFSFHSPLLRTSYLSPERLYALSSGAGKLKGHVPADVYGVRTRCIHLIVVRCAVGYHCSNANLPDSVSWPRVALSPHFKWPQLRA
ncbi:hypothetical protein BC629DRAFT_746026 [Irpex lacteus]|nr:hypothetical protein BC629DRAFT_746026 [Irpex lacteus]